ncbi:hypothetical protein AcV5_002656 [Taiwanofungus camphoratus]|nr:hypothetical protein AcV5_002656 [Antrodia cinnamomea]KAI0918858.1 hypothetical protein AcV7_006970 [Antrodia cinnamomea]
MASYNIFATPADPQSTIRIVSLSQNAGLMELLNVPVDWEFIDYIIDSVGEAVVYGLTSIDLEPHGFFADFVKNVIAKSNIPMSVLLVALCYVTRACTRLETIVNSLEWTYERMFLGAIIVASKYTQDFSLTSKDWAACTGILTSHDINTVERKFLLLLDHSLSVKEADLLEHYDAVMSRCGRLSGYQTCSYMQGLGSDNVRRIETAKRTPSPLVPTGAMPSSHPCLAPLFSGPASSGDVVDMQMRGPTLHQHRDIVKGAHFNSQHLAMPPVHLGTFKFNWEPDVNTFTSLAETPPEYLQDHIWPRPKVPPLQGRSECTSPLPAARDYLCCKEPRSSSPDQAPADDIPKYLQYLYSPRPRAVTIEDLRHWTT